MNSQTGQSLIVTQVANGYLLNLVDEDGNTVDTYVATDTNLRGYGSCDLATAIENIFMRNKPEVPRSMDSLMTAEEDKSI